ncbi:MAG: hypothetical protein V3U58_07915 [Thermodesulfobacteriota bacterium]
MVNNFRIHKLLYSEIKSVYPELFDKILNEKDIPSYIYIGFLEERYVGSISVYLHDMDSAYLQWAGFDENIGKYYRPILFKKVVSFIHQDYRNIICRIENTNTPALKVALNTGFKIIGTRLDGVLFVEMIKTKETKNGT